MAMGMQNGTRQPEMNVTPLIDVLLVLIIIFLVITPISSKGLKTLAPEESQGESNAPSQDIVIEIARDHSLQLNTQRITLNELDGRLHELWKQGANRVVFVKGAHELYFEDIAHVIDVAKGAGYSRVALMP